MSKEMQDLYNANVGWGKLFAPNDVGISAFIKFYANYIINK
jgi:hypothetical protein|tara:strand:+ start:70 stop:192 length:123 start_codon:yes stop_codon:yes gene_type:complete